MIRVDRRVRFGGFPGLAARHRWSVLAQFTLLVALYVTMLLPSPAAAKNSLVHPCPPDEPRRPVHVGAAVEADANPVNWTSMAGANGSRWRGDGSTSGKQLIIVVGAGGREKYAEQFKAWAERWMRAVEDREGYSVTLIASSQPGWEKSIGVSSANGRSNASSNDQVSTGVAPAESSEDNDRQRLRQAIAAARERPEQELWLVLIGHGTFDGETARFNLTGPDFSAQTLAEWLGPAKSTDVIINCASASGPFINVLSGPNRIIVTASKSGYEHNFARFGEYLSKTISDPQYDLDKDGQTSLLEASVAASRQVSEFYESEQRLATEHALVEDNHDGLGTPLDWFRGVRATRQSKTGKPTDGTRANQIFLLPSANQQDWTEEELAKRNRLELELEELRRKKSELDEAVYYQRLEKIMLQLAELYVD